MNDELLEHHLGQLVTAIESQIPPGSHFIFVLVRPDVDAIAFSDLDSEEVQTVLAELQAVMLAGDDET